MKRQRLSVDEQLLKRRKLLEAKFEQKKLEAFQAQLIVSYQSLFQSLRLVQSDLQHKIYKPENAAYYKSLFIDSHSFEHFASYLCIAEKAGLNVATLNEALVTLNTLCDGSCRDMISDLSHYLQEKIIDRVWNFNYQIQSRKSSINHHSNANNHSGHQITLLDIPFDVINKNIFPYKITRDLSDENITQGMMRSSQSCLTLFTRFKPELDKRGANYLLTCVLQGNESKAIAIAKTNPALFFIPSTAYDYAMDFEGNRRIIENWSSYQAMFGTGDFDMLHAVKPYLYAYLSTVPNGHELAKTQEQEKFPNGFDYPESAYDFDELVQAITQDQQLRNTGTPNDTTRAILAALRADFKPGTIKIGYHFNLNDFVKANVAYDENWDMWNPEQLSFFSVYVIGFLERLLPAPYLQQSCQGYINQDQLLNRSYKEMGLETDSPNEIAIFPLDNDSSCRLGEDFVIDIYYGAKLTSVYEQEVVGKGASTILEEYVKQTEQYFHGLRIPNVSIESTYNSMKC